MSKLYLLGNFRHFFLKNQVAKFTKMHKNRVIFEKNGCGMGKRDLLFLRKICLFPKRDENE